MKKTETGFGILAGHLLELVIVAYTVTDLTLAAGYTNVQALDFMGDIFHAMGLMSSSTGWYDTHTSTSGVEVRVIEEVVDASKNYGKIYHLLSTEAVDGGSYAKIYYGTTSGWDVSTHSSTGANVLDYAGSSSSNSWSLGNLWQFHTSIINLQSAGEFKAKVFTESGYPSLVHLYTPSRRVNIGWIGTDASDWRSDVDFDAFMPVSIFGIKGQGSTANITGGYGHVIPRSCYGITPNTSGNNGQQCTVPTDITGWATAGGQAQTYLFNGTGMALWGLNPNLTTTNSAAAANDPDQGPYASADRFEGANYLPLPSKLYNSKTLGPSLVHMVGRNFGSFTPAEGDTLVVTPGVEEYYIIGGAGSNSSTSSTFDVSAIMMRTV